MQNTLIMNKLPLPRYFDGNQWNTVIKPTRKSIPRYLHEDLPQLKLIQLKQRFKQIGKFNCPRLQYFDDYIKKHKTKQHKSQSKSKKKIKQDYEQLKQQLQYALLLCDKKSPVIDNLVSRSRSVKKQTQKKTQIDKSRYFPGTIDLVFKNRRSYFLNGMKKSNEQYSSPVTARIQDIKLISYQ